MPFDRNKKNTILIVDDSKETIGNICDVLKNTYTIKAVNSGEKALQYFEKNNDVDLILLDVLMPNVSGYDVCAYLKKNKKTQNIPIIFLTALETDEDIIKGLKMGAVDYISKPFNAEVLKARIATHLQLKNFQDSLFAIIEDKENLLIKQSKFSTLGEMFENIAHQWKQPISVISSACNNIELNKDLETLDNDILMKELYSIRGSLEHQVKTIDTFKDFIEDKFSKKIVNIYDVLEEVLTLYKSKIYKNTIEIENQVGKNLQVVTDKHLIMQVLLNLVGNAIDILDAREIEEKKIMFSTEQTQSFLKIKVCDNAGGVTIKNKEKLFEKNFTTKEEKSGNGLGLFMSKQIMVKKLDGDLDFFNNDDGACFVITFPYNSDEK